MIDAGTGFDANTYARQVHQHVSRLIEDLEHLHGGDTERIQEFLGQLDLLQQHTQALGFQGISRLLHDMTRCLTEMQSGKCTLSPGTIEVLIDACHVISLHAEATALGIIRPAASANEVQNTCPQSTDLPKHA